jgi:hypothetical protein
MLGLSSPSCVLDALCRDRQRCAIVVDGTVCRSFVIRVQRDGPSSMHLASSLDAESAIHKTRMMPSAATFGRTDVFKAANPYLGTRVLM